MIQTVEFTSNSKLSVELRMRKRSMREIWMKNWDLRVFYMQVKFNITNTKGANHDPDGNYNYTRTTKHHQTSHNYE
jgi:hypothetical protein